MKHFSCGLARLASTFSIVAFDPKTKDLGIGVQSRYFSVGSAVPWAKAGVGAVATQSFVNFTYGPKGLALLEGGFAVDEVLERLTREDKGKESRQVGIVDARGNAASFTGKKCLEWAGSSVGKGYSVQGNILAGEAVVRRMAEDFEGTKGELADRIMAALKGGEEAGGDARGRQSSAMLVVRKDCRGEGVDRLVDLRVEDHEDPIGELQRLLKMQKGYSLIDEGEELMAKGREKEAFRLIERATRINPKSDDAFVDLGLISLKLGRRDEALTAFRRALELNPRLKRVIPQQIRAGTMEIDPETMSALGL